MTVKVLRGDKDWYSASCHLCGKIMQQFPTWEKAKNRVNSHVISFHCTRESQLINQYTHE